MVRPVVQGVTCHVAGAGGADRGIHGPRVPARTQSRHLARPPPPSAGEPAPRARANPTL